MDKKKSVISLEVVDNIVQHGKFPFQGQMSGLQFGGLTPGDQYITPHCWANVKVFDDTNMILVRIYRPRLPGRLNGNILLYELSIFPDGSEYTLKTIYPTDYKRIVLIAHRK